MRFRTILIASSALVSEIACGFTLSNDQLRLRRHQVDEKRRAICVLRDHLPRREFFALIGGVSAGLWLPANSQADESVTESSVPLFNQDGSLKQDVETEAKFRTVAFDWNPSDDYLINVDGENAKDTPNGSRFRVSYQVPEKWTTLEGSKYFDPSERAKACNRIIVYQAPGTITMDRLEKASTIGIAKALSVTGDLQPLFSSDLVSGRTTRRGNQKYFEFDCAVAPTTCSNSKEDLGLGFCPYETIYLLSATQVDGKLYVMVMESGKSEWKRANSDLKRVRSTFTVEAAATRSS